MNEASAREDDRRWYAFRVYYNKVFQAESLLRELGMECYVPAEDVVVERGGAKKRVRRAVVPSLLFARISEQQVAEVEALHGMSIRAYRRGMADGSKAPAPIPRTEMEMFILVSSSGESGLEYFDAEKLDLSVGHRVRVTGGIFEGSVGYIKRIRGNRRFVVTINGVCAVATPYIPVAFLERIDEE